MSDAPTPRRLWVASAAVFALAAIVATVLYTPAEVAQMMFGEADMHAALDDGEPMTVWSVWYNNATLAILLAVGGLVLGLPTVAILAFNGFVLGSAIEYFLELVPAHALAASLAVHGVLEFAALFAAGALGLRLGYHQYARVRGRDVPHPSWSTFLWYGERLAAIYAALAVAAVVEVYVSGAILRAFL